VSDDIAHLQLAEKRLCDAASKIGMNPQSAGLSAFFNSLLLACRVDALIEYTAPFELDEHGTPLMKATFNEILLRKIEAQSQKFESLGTQPRLVAANGNMLNG
jgi:hypothetical protein